MDKFTTVPSPCSINGHNKKFLSFFIWNNQVYPVGAIVKLTFHGDIYLQSGYYDYVTIIDHYFEESTEYWVFFFHKPYETTFRYFRSIHDPEIFNRAIESIDTAPISDSCTEYLNYIKTYKADLNSNQLTKEEYRSFVNKVKAGIPPKAAIPERFKDRDLEELNLKPKYNDFNCPGMIGSWIIFIIFVFATGIFKDWYIQLLLNAYGALVFIGYRQRKLWGFG